MSTTAPSASKSSDRRRRFGPVQLGQNLAIWRSRTAPGDDRHKGCDKRQERGQTVHDHAFPNNKLAAPGGIFAAASVAN